MPVLAMDGLDLEWMNGPEPGTRYRSSDRPDAVFLIEGFQLNCGPCRENAPIVDQFARFYSYEPRVQVLDIGIDSARVNFTNWIRQFKPEHPVLMDQGRKVWTALRGAGTPTMWLLDCKMTVRWSHVGVLDLTAQKDLTNEVDKLLTEKCVL